MKGSPMESKNRRLQRTASRRGKYREGAEACGLSRTALDDSGRRDCAGEKSSGNCPEAGEESDRERQWVVRVGMSCCASERFSRRFSSVDYERRTRFSRDEVSSK